jgi:PAS domain S-box-containing protein
MAKLQTREHLSSPQRQARAEAAIPQSPNLSSLSTPSPLVSSLPLAQLFRESLEAIVIVGGRGEIQLFSRGAERLLGYRAEDVMGKRALSLFVKGAYEVRQLLLQLDRQGFLQNYETQVYRSDHSAMALRLSLTSVRGENGRHAAFFILLHDDLPGREAELQLRRREEELENFVYVISHNLKTPIISVQGFANLLREELGGRLSEEHLHFLDRISKNAMHMEKMILDLLEFSRLGRELPQRGEVEVGEVLREVTEEMRLLHQIARKQEQSGARNLEPPEFVLPPQLPRLWADANGLKTVFQNLLSNALKYRRPEAPLRIEIGWQDLPRFHAFSVRDNGTGMEPLFQKKAFDLFQRGPHVGHVAGTGVGLAVVRRIVENHRGLVRLDSKPGEGTTVYFTIPKMSNLGQERQQQSA